MTTLAPPATAYGVEWELHRPRRGAATATAFYGPAECLTVRGPLLRLRIAYWTRALRRHAATCAATCAAPYAADHRTDPTTPR